MKCSSMSFLRRSLRSAALACGVSLLLAGAGLQARAQTDAGDKSDPITKVDKTDKTDKTVDKTAPTSVGEEIISQTQPIKANYVISVSVVGEPDPSGTYAVDASGNINVKYAGIMQPIKVIGKTPAQTAAAIADYLKVYVKNPQVTVTIVSVPRPVIFIGGAVRNSGPLVIGNEVTLIDVLSRVDPTENSDLSRVNILRHIKVGNEDKVTTLTFNFDKFFRPAPGETPDETQNPVLKDKDRIIVAFKTLPSKGTVSVFGEVEKTQRDIPLPTGQTMTVREAVNIVGGTRNDANRKQVIIRRVGEDRPLVVDLDKAEQGDVVNNITLKPDDTIYVEKLENNSYININGGFVKPGKLIYDKRTTLTQAIGEVGGVAPFAKEGNGVIFRHPDNDAKHSQIIPFNYRDIAKGKAQDIELLAGDSIMLPTGQPPRSRDIFDYVGVFSSVLYTGLLLRSF